MDLPDVESVRPRIRKLWNSERADSIRFYAVYFRAPLLLVLVALAGEKLVYYGLLPLDGYLTREIAYAEAGRAYAAGDSKAAMLSIRKALLQTRDDACLWKLAAKISEQAHSAEATYCWQQADRLKPGSPDTELSLAEAALRDNQLELAAQALREASADEASIRYQIDAGKIAAAGGRRDQARACFDQVEASAPRDAATLFALAAWHAGSSEPAELGRARDLLAELALRSASRPAALRLLVDLDLKRGDVSAARAASEALLSSPGATFPDRIRRLDIAAAESQGNVDARLTVLLQTPAPAERALVLDWMTAHRRAEEALIWIRSQTEELQDEPAIGTARAGCLEALGEWEHLRGDQLASVWPGHEPERLMILAQACLALRNESDARVAWNKAIAACRDAEDFEGLVRFADRLGASHGWDDEKAAAWMAFARRYPDLEWPLRELLAYQLARDDLLQAQALDARLAALDPADPGLAADADLMALLRGVGMARASADLQRLESAVPGNPGVATAAAYALYLAGRFDEALGVLGALTTEELQDPKRAACLGQLLAAAGPVDRADACLKTALAQSNLLPEERKGVESAVDLVNYRRAMADLLHAPDGPAAERSRAFFSWRAGAGSPVFLLGESVAQARGGHLAQAVKTLGKIEPATLAPAELTIYDGAVLELSGESGPATACLELVTDLPFQTGREKLHRALDGWWSVSLRQPLEASDGLFATYRALEAREPGEAFWRSDAAREMKLTRAALLHGTAPAAVQDRLESLLRHVPSTPEIEAQIGYALFLEGRVQAARERLEILSAGDLAEPEAAFYYGTILQACGESKLAGDYFRRAGALPAATEQMALQRAKP